MANCAIVGINWGDEGKGRMVDYLTDHYDVVVRYQGGGNAGHTVVNEKGKFALHLLPSGIFRDGVVNILGNGVALDCENLLKEIETVRRGGVDITPKNLMVSQRASLLLPWYRELDALEEGLDTIFEHLAPGGRLCVITFHSLEDRLVKNKFRRWAQRCTCPPEQPICTCGGVAKAKLITRKPIEADAAELETNRRSRSAKLRVLEKA